MNNKKKKKQPHQAGARWWSDIENVSSQRRGTTTPPGSGAPRSQGTTLSLKGTTGTIIDTTHVLFKPYKYRGSRNPLAAKILATIPPGQ